VSTNGGNNGGGNPGPQIWGGEGPGPGVMGFDGNAGNDPSPDPLTTLGPGDVTVLYGYFWSSAGPPPSKRLYVTWTLDEYIDLSHIDILFWRKIPYGGGTVLWVRRNSELPRVKIPGNVSTQASFLGGSIARTYLSGASADAMTDPSQVIAAPESVPCGTPPYCH
jgi:hypothetical protein